MSSSMYRRRPGARLGAMHVAACAVFGGALAITQAARVPFEYRDDAAREPGLLAARAAIVDELDAGDGDAVERWLAADFNGGPFARAEATRALRTSATYRRDLAEAVSHGGAFSEGRTDRFCGPYWHAVPIDVSRLPDHLVFEGLPWVVVVPDAPVLASRASGAPTVGHVGFELIKVFAETPEDQVGDLVAVEFAGRRGYVARSAVRDPAERTRVCFERRDNRWWLTQYLR